MIALLGSPTISPHLLSQEGVRIRDAHSVDVLVPWDDIASLATRMRSPGSGRAAHVGRSGTEPVRVVRCFADDSADLVSHARGRLPANGV